MAGQSIAPPIMLLAFLEEGSDDCFLPTLRNIPQVALVLSKIIESDLDKWKEVWAQIYLLWL